MSWLDSPTGRIFSLLDPETAHRLSILALSWGLVRRPPVPLDVRLCVTVAGITFANPLGVAAGYDKDARVPDALLALGFGHVEIGTVTPLPQPGNPKPRIFRLADHEAVINRLGFNSAGHDIVASRLRARSDHGGIIGINIGTNRNTQDVYADYERGLEVFWKDAGYFTINISSPNTPGLRSLQYADRLKLLTGRIDDRARRLFGATGIRRPIFVKIAPDLDEQAIAGVADTIANSTVDGLVVANTTLSRNGVGDDPLSAEAGGLSGKPLKERSTIILARLRQRLGQDFPLVGVGGVSETADAVDKIEAGADLVQLYTGFIFGGPSVAREILAGLTQWIEREGVKSISELKGTKTRSWADRPIPLSAANT